MAGMRILVLLVTNTTLFTRTNEYVTCASPDTICLGRLLPPGVHRGKSWESDHI